MADEDITHILASADETGLPRGLADRVFAAAYDELKAVADNQMRDERDDHTLQPTALLNEAYVRLVDPAQIRWESRSHFFAIASRAMRQVLVDHARRRGAAKRGGGWKRVLLEDVALALEGGVIDAFDLEDALTKLAAEHPRSARVVELRVFGGLSGQEIAAAVGVSRKTIIEDWRFASMWLRAELAGTEG